MVWKKNNLKLNYRGLEKAHRDCSCELPSLVLSKKNDLQHKDKCLWTERILQMVYFAAAMYKDWACQTSKNHIEISRKKNQTSGELKQPPMQFFVVLEYCTVHLKLYFIVLQCIDIVTFFWVQYYKYYKYSKL